MKITDFSIIFAAVFVSFCLTYYIGEQAAFSSSYYTTIQNNVMDEIVRDSLEAGYVGFDKDGEPEVNLDMVLQNFREECGTLMQGGKWQMGLPVSIKKMVYVESDAYYVYEAGSFKTTKFPANVSHERRVDIISNVLEEALRAEPGGRYQIRIPGNQGEWDSQTIGPHMLLVLCKEEVIRFQDTWYGSCFLSGAAIKEKK